MTESVQDFAEELPCGYLVTALDGTITRVNRTFLAWTGFTGEELTSGKRLQDLLTVPGKLFYENQYFPLLRMQGFVREVAFDLIGAQGARLPMLINSAVKLDEHGQPSAVISAVFMATDRRTYEQELLRARQEAEELSAIVTMSADAIARCSADGVVLTWNAGAQRMFDLPEAQARGMHLQELLPSIVDGEWVRLLDVLQRGESVHVEATGCHGDGTPLDVSVGLAPHAGPLGELGGISAIIRDISERKAIERLQNEFLAMISHELRTPLTAIRGHAQLMQRRGTYEASYVQHIVGAADQLGRLIEDLLLASRLEADRFGMQPAEVDLRVIVRLAVDQIAAASWRAIRLDMPGDSLPVWGDALRLGQVFANLLSNAVKYSSEGTDVDVRVSRSASEVIVAVTDRGAGIAQDDIPHLFSRFYRVAGTAEQVQGAGLGLYIADRLVRAHGGNVVVESEVGHGSTFTVSLPLHRGPVTEAGSPSTSYTVIGSA